METKLRPASSFSLDGFSVGIPIFNDNEVKTLRDTVRSILADPLCSRVKGNFEILVYANGKPRRVIEVAEKLEMDHPGIELLIDPKPGKPNAWNQLRKLAENDLLFLADGDIVVGRGALEKLALVLTQDPALICAAAAPVPVVEGAGWLTKLINPPGPWTGGLCGRLYCVDNALLESYMKTRGLEEMPLETMREDLWVEALLGGDRWQLVPEARVYFTPYSWFEFPRMQARDHLGWVQIQTTFPLFSRDIEPKPLWKVAANYLSKLRQPETRRAEVVARTVAWNLLTALGRLLATIQKMLGSRSTETAVSRRSKRPFSRGHADSRRL